MTKVADEKAYSIFDVRTLSEIHQEIQQLYLGDSRPWVVGYSGGKDSTTALQLIWHTTHKGNTLKGNTLTWKITKTMNFITTLRK